jgi:hypothetical protein
MLIWFLLLIFSSNHYSPLVQESAKQFKKANDEVTRIETLCTAAADNLAEIRAEHDRNEFLVVDAERERRRCFEMRERTLRDVSNGLYD